MKLRFIVIGLAMAGLALCAAYSQTSSATSPTVALEEVDEAEDNTTYAPFINRLRVAVKEPQVRLTWEDIADFQGSYRIYRYTAEIGFDNLAKADMVSEVSQGEQFYTDIPPKSGSYYYAVLARENTGNLYQIFIPFRNKTLSPISITVTATTVDLVSDITAFQANVVSQSIEVTLSSSRNTRQIAIFRGTEPILTNDAVLKAVQVWTGTGRSVRMQDYAVPGVPYYYAAVDTEAFQKGGWTLVAGKNSLKEPVEIPLGSKTVTVAGLGNIKPIRVMPLPILTLSDLNGAQPVLDGTNQIQVFQPLDPATKAKIAALTANIKTGQAARKTPELLPTDRQQLEGRAIQSPTGETKVLAEILAKDFTRTNWDESIRQLGNLLTLPLSRSLQAKAHFYLAQAYYQSGNYKEALMEFLFVQDELPEYAQPWVDNTLQRSKEW